MADVISGPPGAAVIPCPLPHCEWAHTVRQPGPEEHPGALAEIFGWGVFAATAAERRLRDTEETLRAHLSGHDLAEWVAEVTRLRDENARLRAGTVTEWGTRRRDGHVHFMHGGEQQARAVADPLSDVVAVRRTVTYSPWEEVPDEP